MPQHAVAFGLPLNDSAQGAQTLTVGGVGHLPRAESKTLR